MNVALIEKSPSAVLSGCQKMAKPAPVVITCTPLPMFMKPSTLSMSASKSSLASQPAAWTPWAPATKGRTNTATAAVAINIFRITASSGVRGIGLSDLSAWIEPR